MLEPSLYSYPKSPTDDLPPSKRMNYHYLYELTSSLSKYNELFYALHEIGVPTLTTTVETACVGFRNDDTLLFHFNPEWMDTLTDYEVKFVFCHEALHIVYQHGLRGKSMMFRNIANIAADICVNDSLIYHFCFERERLPKLGLVKNHDDKKDTKTYSAWFDNVFSPEMIAAYDIRRGQNMEYYYNILTSIHKEELDAILAIIESMDDHEILIETSTEENNKATAERIEGELSNPRKLQGLIEHQLSSPAGSGGATGWTFVPRKKVRKNDRWEQIIMQWAKSRIKSYYKQRFINEPRRYMDVLSKRKDVSLPGPHECKMKIPQKKKVLAFLDVSGSCTDLAPTFFYALESIPKEYFEVIPFAFDTSVVAINMEDRRLPSGGGTSFCILEDAVQSYMKENNEQYPEGIFVLTDGYGDDIKPQIGARWHWFLSKGGSKQNIPDDCHVYDLEKYYREG